MDLRSNTDGQEIVLLVRENLDLFYSVSLSVVQDSTIAENVILSAFDAILEYRHRISFRDILKEVIVSAVRLRPAVIADQDAQSQLGSTEGLLGYSHERKPRAQ